MSRGHHVYATGTCIVACKAGLASLQISLIAHLRAVKWETITTHMQRYVWALYAPLYSSDGQPEEPSAKGLPDDSAAAQFDQVSKCLHNLSSVCLTRLAFSSIYVTKKICMHFVPSFKMVLKTGAPKLYLVWLGKAAYERNENHLKHCIASQIVSHCPQSSGRT